MDEFCTVDKFCQDLGILFKRSFIFIPVYYFFYGA
jgi:hypothetical protein